MTEISIPTLYPYSLIFIMSLSLNPKSNINKLHPCFQSCLRCCCSFWGRCGHNTGIIVWDIGPSYTALEIGSVFVTPRTSVMPWRIRIFLVRTYQKPLTIVTRTNPTILQYPAIISPIQTWIPSMGNLVNLEK